MTATSDAMSIRNDDECHHKQTFYIPPIDLQSMDTFTAGRKVLFLSYVMDGIEKSCLRHKYSFPIALTARRNCKKLATFSTTLVICGLEKFFCSIQLLHSHHSQTKKKKKEQILDNKKMATNVFTYMELFS